MFVREFVKFPSIGSLASVKKFADYLLSNDKKITPIRYRGKVKLHGTNAGVTVLPTGEVFAQSRSRIITPADDNVGFASWVKSQDEEWPNLRMRETPITFFGEWCGSGIQKGVAISEIDRKVFVVFAIQYCETMIVEPEWIEEIMAPVLRNTDDIFVLPWADAPVLDVDFTDSDTLRAAAAQASATVEAVEKCDPWVKSVFNVEGIGEGLVYYPCSISGSAPGGVPINLDRDYFSEFVFKAKGEKHQVVKTKAAVEVDPEVVASVEAFVSMVVTSARLEQALDEGAGGSTDKRNTGAFIGWLAKDIKKDIDNGLVDLPEGVEWKKVNSSISAVGRKWFFERGNDF